MAVLLHRVDAGDVDAVPLDLDGSGLDLGRGPLLKIDATNISRKHAHLKLVNGKIILKCLHRLPVTVVAAAGAEVEVRTEEELELHTGDTIKFTPDRFHYELEVQQPKISSPTSSPNMLAETDESAPENEAEEAEATSVVKPGPTEKSPSGKNPGSAEKPSSEKKPRNLPAWMLKGDSAVNKENSPPKSGSPEQKSSKRERNRPSPDKKKDLGARPKSNDAVSSGSKQKQEPTRSTQNASESEGPKDLGEAGTSENSSAAGSKPRGTPFPVVIQPGDIQDSEDEEIDRSKPGPDRKKRPRCQYGANCYRKNPQHRQREAHPGEPDYEESQIEEDDTRPECEYGVDCYRKNPNHRKNFKHTHKHLPKRAAKVEGRKKKKDEDEYESDFVDDSEEDEPVDDTDEDENWVPSKDKDEDD